MNILTIVILAVLALNVFEGYKKGFLKTAFSLVAWLIVLVLCNFVTPVVTEMLVEKTEIEVVVQTTVDTKINEVINETLETSDLTELEAALPAELKDALLGENESLQEAVASGVKLDTKGLVNGIVGIFGFVITVIILRLLMVAVEIVLNIVAKLPLIGPMDTLLGLACGVGKGIVLCWVILAIVAVLALTGTNTELAAYISQSELLTWLQDNNVLLNLILDVK